MEKFNVAIDGPAGAGKSTIARLVANDLGFVYIDTGAMYRAVTWKILQEGLQPEQIVEMVAIAGRMEIRLTPGEEGQLVFVDGENVTSEIRSALVTSNVSRIASIAEIRQILTVKQKEMAKDKGVVMDGRDIGSQVLPDAEVKIFLTASVKIRAERRYKEIFRSQPDITLERLEKEIAERDRLDEQRETAPLMMASDAVFMDTTDMTIPEVVDRILELCKTRVGRG